MADINRKKSQLIRSCPEFKEFILKMSRLKSQQENEEIKSSRITQAIYKQYVKYPELSNEIKQAKLGKWKSK